MKLKTLENINPKFIESFNYNILIETLNKIDIQNCIVFPMDYFFEVKGWEDGFWIRIQLFSKTMCCQQSFD